MKRKIGFIDVLRCSNIEELEEMRDKSIKRIEGTKNSMRSSVKTLWGFLQNAYEPISKDTYLFENDNPLDVFKDIDEDIIYINGNVFSIKEKYLKHYIDVSDSQERNKRFISQMKEYFDIRIRGISTQQKIINKIDEELEERRIK